MKKLILSLAVLAGSLNAWSVTQSPNSLSGPEWVQLQGEIEPALLMIQNTTVTTTICEESTGANYFSLPADQKANAVVVSCIEVDTVNTDTKNALDVLFPVGTKIKGVYIVNRVVGHITPL